MFKQRKTSLMSLWNVFLRLWFPCHFQGAVGEGGWTELVTYGVRDEPGYAHFIFFFFFFNVSELSQFLCFSTSGEAEWAHCEPRKRLVLDETHHLGVCFPSSSQPASANCRVSLFWWLGVWHRQPIWPVQWPLGFQAGLCIPQEFGWETQSLV